MASTNKVFVSPGVYTSERDLTFVAQSVGVTTLGIVGETLQGPAFEPIFITNFDEYQVYFGGTSPEKFTNTQIPKYETSYIAKAYLQQSNQLFVTRVLGLSGYDAGPSWSITTIGNVDPGTVGLSANTSGLQIVNFTGTTGGSSNVVITGTLPSLISADFYNPYTTFNGGSSTLNANFQSFIANEIVYQSTASLNAQSGTTALFWGTVSDATFNSVTGATIGAGLSAYSETFGVSNVLLSQANLSATTNDPWYYALFDYSQVASVGSYNGYGFGTTLGAINSIGVGSYSGYCIVSGTTYSGTPYSGWDDLVIATLRSRGITNYSATQSGPLYQVTGITDVQMVCTGSYSAVTKDPYATFVVSGITKDADTFTFETSLLSTDTEYLSKVFGRSNFGKDRTEVPLFVEEVYSSLLLNGYRQGKVRGLNCDLIELNSAVSQASGSIGFYLEQYQTPETPYLVSELRGNKVYKLFKFKLISDGNAANRLVKISIGNVSFNNGTFDVFVRDFYDNDQNVRVIESFTNCSLNPTLNNYVANKIGTANGEYNLNSKYIMLEMSDEAPEDALPCGFDGYIMRNYDQAQPPFIVYKTRYLKPGDVIYNPPFGSTSGADNPVISNGENPRKAYLGISNITGVDYDYFEYKGKQLPANLETDTTGPSWTYQIKGFHMDSGATVVTMFDTLTSATTQAFEVGAGSFNSEPTDPDNPYYRLNTRKFTLYPYGGFDGWDIYREYRTNSDTYALGQTGYKYGAAPSSQFPTATGWGAFKQISGPNQEVWANTDYYAYKWGQTTFANPEAVNINVFTTPGIDYVNNSNLVEDAIDMVETDRADSIYICTTPDFNLFLPTFSDVSEGLIYPQEAVDNLEETGIDSNYTATYYPWVLTRDSVNNTQIYLPATAEVTKNLALTDNIAFPWFASAGYTRGLVNSIKARKKLTQEDRDTLYKGRVNPIATFSDVGTVIWGNKTLQIRESALDRINVRRLLLQARKLISAVAVRLLFEQNDDKVRQDFLDSVNPILDSIRRDRGLIDFRVTVSNTPEDLDSNTLTGKIFLKPTRALEYIDIEFVITPTGASFDDV
jgi:phage tail sheath protein FI